MMTRVKHALLLFWWALRYALITLRHKYFVMHGYYKARVPWWFWRAIWHDVSKFGPSELFGYGFAFCGPLSKLSSGLRDGEIVVEKGTSDSKKLDVFFVYAQERNNPDKEHRLGQFKDFESASQYRDFLLKCRMRFAHAWLHHQNTNKHHWEYWIPRTSHFNTDPKMRGGNPIPMPTLYMREMVGDWLGAGRAYTGVWDMEDWLSKNIGKIQLHDKTGDDLQDMLESMYGPAWVESVYNRAADGGWDALFDSMKVSFGSAPEDWIEMHFTHRPIICDITSAESKKRPWTRMLVRMNDRNAFESLHEKKIDVRDILKDAGSGKVFVFYRLLEEDEGVAVDSATTDSNKAQEALPQEGTSNENESGSQSGAGVREDSAGGREDDSAANTSAGGNDGEEGDSSSLEGGVGQPDDDAEESDEDESYDDGDDGAGDTTDSDPDEEGDGDDERTPPSRSPSR